MSIGNSSSAERLSQEEARRLRSVATAIRKSILRQLYDGGGGHGGGAFSGVEILTVLYFNVLNIDPARPDWQERDRFVMSKGHACPAWYSVLAEKGYFPKEALKTARQVGSILQGHPDMKKTPGVDMTTGSLGQGFSAALGIALAARVRQMSYRTYALLGDGELDEGQVWEAAMAAAHFRVDSLTAIVDRNRLQVDGDVREIMALEPLAEKWRAFGWHVIEINGHDVSEIHRALGDARETQGRPTVIIAHTVKGKGVSFMEGDPRWHSAHLSKEELDQALAELGAVEDA